MSRDQATSAFTDILKRLCGTTGSSAAALVDVQGETVDYYSGDLAAHDVRVLGAEWRLVLDTLQRSRAQLLATTHLILVRARSGSFGILALPGGYAFVLQFPRHCFWVSERALAAAAREVCVESGIAPATSLARGERWLRVKVQTAPDDRRRPVAVWHRQDWRGIVILGRYQRVDAAGRELGYRARLDGGVEFTLVREPLGAWYAEHLD
jgi:hypothetical protein